MKRHANRIRDSSNKPPHLGRLFSCPGGLSRWGFIFSRADLRRPV